MFHYLYLYSTGNYSTPLWFTLPLDCFGLHSIYTALGYLPSTLLWVTLTLQLFGLPYTDEDYATSTLLVITFCCTLFVYCWVRYLYTTGDCVTCTSTLLWASLLRYLCSTAEYKVISTLLGIMIYLHCWGLRYMYIYSALG